MTTLALYLVLWSSWILWVQTVGRLPYALTLPPTLVFDALAVACIYFFSRGKKWEWPTLPSWFWIAAASIFFTAVLQIPMDWDGQDYHLPPLIEALQRGHWAHSENPYYASRVFPKTAGYLQLWWLIHSGKIVGLRGVLIVSVLHWAMALVALRAIFGKSEWLLALWLALPLAARGAVSSYADLPALAALICFALFVLKERWWLAGIALALHGSMKFTHIASGAGALVAICLWWIYAQKIKFSVRIKPLAILAGLFAIGILIQPVENILTEGKPFGPLKCSVLGHDFCKGTITPGDMVVAPVIDFPREQKWFIKVARGWTPSQVIPGFDVDKGGFGWVWLIPFIAALLHLNQRRREFFRSEAGAAVLILFAADLCIPALWYARYHLALGAVLTVLAAYGMQKIPRKLALVLVITQLVWLFPQRSWFLGAPRSGGVVDTLVNNVSSIVSNGYPSRATHPADVRSLALYSDRRKGTVHVCSKNVRPVLAAYGKMLQRKVKWDCEGDPREYWAQYE